MTTALVVGAAAAGAVVAAPLLTSAAQRGRREAIQYLLARLTSAGSRTPAWVLVALKLLMAMNPTPGLMDYQPALPALPLPKVEDTLERWLRSVRPWLAPADYDAAARAAETFLATEAAPLQEWLLARAKACAEDARAAGGGGGNWLSDLWLEFAYLRGRVPLVVNSSFYSTDLLRKPAPTDDPAARGASLVIGALEFKDRVETRSLRPFFVGGVAPVDMSGYDTIFGMNRIPGEEVDELVQYNTPRHGGQPASDPRRMGDAHIVVVRGTAMYSVPVQRGGERISEPTLRAVLRSILDTTPMPLLDPSTHSDAGGAHTRKPEVHSDALRPSPLEDGLAPPPAAWSFGDAPPVTILTTDNRTSWAHTRAHLQRLSATNLASLRTIDSAVMCLTLDPRSPTDHPTGVSWMGFHGDGMTWWADKCFNACIFENARACFHVEHSPSDAPVPSHAVEHIYMREQFATTPLAQRSTSLETVGADSPFAPQRLCWTWDETAQAALDTAADRFHDLANTSDVTVHAFHDYGKDQIKRFRVSPDAFVQMMLQVASRAFFGRSVLTYESASTRAFYMGRTETIRSCSAEAVDFADACVESMGGAEAVVRERAGDDDDDAVAPAPTTPEPSVEVARDLVAKLRAACTRHRELTADAMAGRGVDRHMLGMRLAGLMTGRPAADLWGTAAWQAPFELSTSQTPLVQEHVARIKSPEQVSFGGGFGPVCAGGVGVSYFIMGPALYFHVSANGEADPTDEAASARGRVERFQRALRHTLQHVKRAWDVVQRAEAEGEGAVDAAKL